MLVRYGCIRPKSPPLCWKLWWIADCPPNCDFYRFWRTTVSRNSEIIKYCLLFHQIAMISSIFYHWTHFYLLTHLKIQRSVSIFGCQIVMIRNKPLYVLCEYNDWQFVKKYQNPTFKVNSFFLNSLFSKIRPFFFDELLPIVFSKYVCGISDLHSEGPEWFQTDCIWVQVITLIIQDQLCNIQNLQRSPILQTST